MDPEQYKRREQNPQEPGRVYTGSAINHPDATPEFRNRTLKRRAKNRVAKQSRKKNR